MDTNFDNYNYIHIYNLFLLLKTSLENIQKQHSNVLWIVLFINLIMFVIELVSGFRAKSLALTGDSLDMLGDSLVYGSSIFVIYKSKHAQARVALLKGFIMLGFAFIVLLDFLKTNF